MDERVSVGLAPSWAMCASACCNPFGQWKSLDLVVDSLHRLMQLYKVRDQDPTTSLHFHMRLLLRCSPAARLHSYTLPEYTAYDSMLSVFRRLVPIPSLLAAQNNYRLNTEQLRQSIQNQGISVVVGSNPRNPTGTVVKGDDMRELVELAREGPTTMVRVRLGSCFRLRVQAHSALAVCKVLDEFYSWYQYDEDGKSRSAAEYIEDVNKDAVVLVDGLTKNWRLPGFRCCWVVGPEKVIEALSQSGSFLDGGTCEWLPQTSSTRC